MMKKETARMLLAFAFGIAILSYLFWSMGPDNIIRLLVGVKIEFFLLAALFYFLGDVLGALALKLAIDGRMTLRKILPSHMCGMLYSAVTPGRVGYYYTAFAISKKTGGSRSKNIGTLTLLQGLGFGMKVIACIIAVIYFSRLLISQESTAYFIMASLVPVLFIIPIVLILYTTIPNRIVSKVPWLGKALRPIVLMQESRRDMNTKKMLAITLINLLGWFVLAAQWFFLAQSMGLEISYWDAFMLQPLLSVVMFLPVTPSGLGITEGGSALLFALILSSMPPVEAKAAGVTFILLVRLNGALVDSFGLIDMKIHGRRLA